MLAVSVLNIPTEAQSVFESLHQQLSAIETISVRTTATFETTLPPIEYSFCQSQNLIKAATNLQIELCDGARCNFLDTTGTLYTHKNVRKPFYVHAVVPIFMPFQAVSLRNKRDESLSTFKNPDFWTQLADEGTYNGESERNGKKCARYTFDNIVLIGSGEQGYAKVDFCPVMGSWPIVVEEFRLDGTLNTRLTILEIATLPANGISVTMPVSLKMESFDTRGQIGGTVNLKVDRSSLQINEPLPIETFSFPAGSVKKFVDIEVDIE